MPKLYLIINIYEFITHIALRLILVSSQNIQLSMPQKKKVELTRLQGGIAIASFSSGVTIAAVCLFFIPPLGEIASSAVSIVSELLVLCGAILGVKASYDVKFRKFEAELRDVREHETQPTT